MHRLRAGIDAIAVGIGTVLADDPALTVRDVPAPRVAPTRVVFDRAGAAAAGSALARTARDVPTDRRRRIRADRGRATALEARGRARAAHARRSRRAATRSASGGIRSLLVEGGARLAGALLGAGLVDRLIIFQSSLVLGAGALGAFAFVPPIGSSARRAGASSSGASSGDDTMTVYAPLSSD